VDIQQLRCFLAVAEELHFGRAAQRLHLTPSPVSRAVRDLECELGADLFVRTHHHVELTPAGRLLAVRGAAVVADFERLRHEVAAVADPVVHLGGTYMAPPSARSITRTRERGSSGVLTGSTGPPRARDAPSGTSLHCRSAGSRGSIASWSR
jgi:DNA-binding transcriptional LysR family regulator